MPLCHAVNDIGEIGFRVEAVEFGGFEHGVDDGGAVAAGLGAEEQVVFTGDGNGAQGALGGVIVDADVTVGGVEAQAVPAAERISQYLSTINFGLTPWAPRLLLSDAKTE